MDIAAVQAALDSALVGKRLLEHPFYRRWEAGALAPGELAAYAEQYRGIERALPEALLGIVEGLPEGPPRELVAENLADELGPPRSHADLFESFAEAAGARRCAPMTAATAALVDLELQAARRDPISALAVIAAYEVQAAGIATTKAEGLRQHYGLDAAGTEFWDVHSTLEADHAAWSIAALAALAEDPDQVVRPARAAAEAWWSFLDEREALAPIRA
jgi:pyrroloquinoline quinone (PQQ) biosynthesis protein C